MKKKEEVKKPKEVKEAPKDPLHIDAPAIDVKQD